MTVRFRLPDIGEGLSEAELLAWTVQVGDSVEEGDELAVISTDKVNVDLPSPASGVIRELCCEVGEIVPVGTVIVVIDDGRDEKEDQRHDRSSHAPAEPRINPIQHSSGAPGSTIESAEYSERASVKAAPVTRRLAAELGVDIDSVTGTGPGGQVLNRDVEQQASGAQAAGTPSDRRKLRGARLAAARHLAESSRQLATTSMTFEAAADALLELTESRKAAASERGIRLTPLAAVAHCVIRTLCAHPHFNARISESDNELLMYEHVNLGLAVHSDNGLLVPVMKNVHKLDLLDLAEALERTACAVREQRLSVADLQGSTFTLSSTGGLEQATFLATTPVINLPNVATLWVSRITERPRVRNSRLEAGPMITGTLAFDHRYLHGADGVAFINDLVGAFQEP